MNLEGANLHQENGITPTPIWTESCTLLYSNW